MWFHILWCSQRSSSLCTKRASLHLPTFQRAGIVPYYPNVYFSKLNLTKSLVSSSLDTADPSLLLDICVSPDFADTSPSSYFSPVLQTPLQCPLWGAAPQINLTKCWSSSSLYPRLPSHLTADPENICCSVASRELAQCQVYDLCWQSFLSHLLAAVSPVPRIAFVSW